MPAPPPLPSSKTEPTTSTTSTAKEKKEKKESSSGNGSAPKSEADLLFNLHNKARTVFVTGTIDDRLSHRVVADKNCCRWLLTWQTLSY